MNIQIVSLLFISFFFLINSPTVLADHADVDDSKCMSVIASLTVDGEWPGGSVTISCKGGEDYFGEGSYCKSDTKQLTPGNSVRLHGCDCIVDSRVRQEQTSLPEGCTFVNEEYKGSNQDREKEINILVRCEKKEAPPPPPPAPACNCQFTEDCRTSNGKAGTRTCTGSGDENSCSYNDQCPANCGPCRANPGQETPPPPPQGGNPPPGGETPPPPPPGGETPPPPPPGGETPPPPPGGETPPPPPPPPPPGESPSPSPSRSPSPSPSRSPSPKPSPSPLFSDAMCKCDGITPNALISGEAATITAGAKVEGKDVNYATVKDMTFTLVEGDNTKGIVLSRGNKIAAKEISRTASLVRYQSSWKVNLPQFKKGKVYRIFANVACQKKQTAMLPALSNVLGTTAEDQDWLESIWSTFSNPLTNTATVPSPSPSPSLLQVLKVIPTPSPTESDDALQLGTLEEAQIIEKSCRFIKFQLDE